MAKENHSNDCTKIEKGCRRFQELKEKVKQEVKQLEMKQINKKQNNRYYSSSFTSKSELLNNGWILSSQEMQFLRNHPYIYCAFAGSYLELLFLQRWFSFFFFFFSLSLFRFLFSLSSFNNILETQAICLHLCITTSKFKTY